MPNVNNVHLSGYIYRPTERTTKNGAPITTFGMRVYAGKDADGKSIYEFINVKYFGHLMNNQGEKDVIGRLAVDSWEKDGVKHKNFIVIASSVVEDISEPAKKEPKPEPEPVQTFDDEVPW